MAFDWRKIGPTKHSVAKKTACKAGHLHDSKREAKRCDELHLMQDAGLIAGLRIHPQFKFIIDGEPVKLENGQCAGVTLDFSYCDGEQLICEDVKGRSKLSDSRDWPLRKAIFKHLYKGWVLREIRK